MLGNGIKHPRPTQSLQDRYACIQEATQTRAVAKTHQKGAEAHSVKWLTLPTPSPPRFVPAVARSRVHPNAAISHHPLAFDMFQVIWEPEVDRCQPEGAGPGSYRSLQTSLPAGPADFGRG